ncbi:hypothetical protein ACIPJ1_10720 [Microbacterium maritypicum]|uniref:hypothetical protein n=1 Tax=Microbacterium maritypicum TaxID=33918 RepID=UPI00380E0A86
MDVIGLVVAVLALLVGGASAVYARGANRWADDANRTAASALNLQGIIDAREREFRAVDWDADVVTVGSGDAFALTNIGETEALAVTVVLKLSRERETYVLERIPAKSTVTLNSAKLTRWMVEARDHEVVHPGYRIHWSSPLGQASDEERPLRSVEDFIDWGIDEAETPAQESRPSTSLVLHISGPTSVDHAHLPLRSGLLHRSRSDRLCP